MGRKPDSLPSGQFIRELRNALNHLYDPDYLRRSPLAAIFGVSGRFDTPSALQGILHKAVESLKPAPAAPNRAHARAIYDLLLYRYVQQVSQDEIANQLGVSVRQLRRQQNLAIYELASKLWDQYALAASLAASAVSSTEAQDAANPTAPIVDELGWLREASLQHTTDLAAGLREVRNLILPLAEQRGVRLHFPSSVSEQALVHPVAFQQILLNLLSLAVQRAEGSEVRLDTLSAGGHPAILLSGRSRLAGEQLGHDERNWLGTVGKLVDLCQAEMEHEITGTHFRFTVRFAPVEQLDVLVIDDNPEIATMMQRMVAETRYRVTGVRDPRTSVEQALQLRPDLIVLDIMMPQIDGLQILSRLRHHPELARTPVIVCSVLPQKDLAASLGAGDFIQKPVQRDALIAALDRQSRRG